tara:strand:- start:3306 stop:3554 length:249 start_codon:yes stop_codon:yes gene_type:complete
MAKEGYPCCSIKCRDAIPNCKMDNCEKAVVPGIYQGDISYSEYCYKHGGRIKYDGEEVSNDRFKTDFVYTSLGWVRIAHLIK